MGDILKPYIGESIVGVFTIGGTITGAVIGYCLSLKKEALKERYSKFYLNFIIMSKNIFGNTDLIFTGLWKR